MFFTPRYVKDARQFCEAARRIIRYRLDLMTPKQIAELDERVAALDQAAKDRDRELVKARTAELERSVGKMVPARSNAAWRENCEVLLVAIVIAAGVRAYLLEPFKIPTGSMQPTLNGVIGVATTKPPPNPLVRAFDFVARGRTFIDKKATVDDVVVKMEEKSRLNYFTWTEITCEHSSYTIFAPMAVVQRDFNIWAPDPQFGRRGTVIKAGEILARGYVDSGDFVLVNKLAYNFAFPKSGDVFVFRTTGITRIEAGIPEDMGSQHYIKRLAGVPGYTLRIAEPQLFINGKLATGIGFQRVMSLKGDYKGYSNPSSLPPYGADYLTSPEDIFPVPEHAYFALGDNSFHSSDSRYWGIVPEHNVTGKAFIAFWPFSAHWGFIE
ncbi:MAG: signal peptidase I [Chthoniobacterales bacterium]